MLPVTITCANCTLRPWEQADKASLLRHANNRNVWRNLRDIFPHPYTEVHADEWLARAAARPAPEGLYAIAVDAAAVGTIAIHRGSDVDRFSVELGYWLGEEFWGRGIATAAVGRVTEAALAEPDVLRVFAPVFSWNLRSMRVLERNGFVREGVLRRAGFKDGHVIDRVLYARTRESDHPYSPVT